MMGQIAIWTNISGRPSSTFITRELSAFTMRSRASLATDSLILSTAARLLAVLSLHGSPGLANGGSFIGKSAILWPLIS